MIEKWYVIKVSKENKIKFSETEDYLVSISYEDLEEDVERYGDTIVLITPSEEIARKTKKQLNEFNEQLQE